MTLARRTDGAVFSGREPAKADVQAVWSEALAAVEAARQTLPWWRRLAARYRLASIVSWSRRVARMASSTRPPTFGGHR
jgi:hypothetical protein